MNRILAVTRTYVNRETFGKALEEMRKPRLTLKEQIFLAKRLAFFVKAGVPLIEAFSMIRAQTRSASKSRLYDTLIEDIANGQYLSTSLERMQTVFTPFAVHIIRVGETSGILTENLAYLADELTKRKELRSKIASALIYPAFITIATLGVTILLTVFIFPKILPIFSSLHVPLPMTTLALIAISAYFQSYGILTLLLLIAAGIVFYLLKKRYEKIAYYTDRFMLSLPILGSIMRSYNLATLCRTLGLMLRSGIPITQAMTVVTGTTSNLVYKKVFEEATEVLVRGETISEGFSVYPKLFGDTLIHMVAVGEKTGNLSQTLMYLSELYETEVNDLTKNLSSSIEPVLMLIMGLIVGLIAVSVITPIYSITQHLSPR